MTSMAEVTLSAAEILHDLIGGTVRLARRHPTRHLHEALAALGEAEARVRFAAAVLAEHEAERGQPHDGGIGPEAGGDEGSAP